jgi:hypothetical protein
LDRRGSRSRSRSLSPPRGPPPCSGRSRSIQPDRPPPRGA